MARTGRFDLTWMPRDADAKRIVFEIDSCWRHESLLKLGRLADSDCAFGSITASAPSRLKPEEPGLRKLNILRYLLRFVRQLKILPIRTKRLPKMHAQKCG